MAPRPDRGKRRYQQTVRAERAAATRAAIRAAATEMFTTQGYTATSLRQVAQHAGVAERTVYAVYPNKPALFNDCLTVAIRGAEGRPPVAISPQTQQMLADTDPLRTLGGAVDTAADLLDRAGDLIMVSVEAAGTDPDMRAAADAGAAATHTYQLALAQHLHQLGALHPGLTATTAADILYTLTSPHLHQLLRRHRRWSSHRYRAWLLTTLEHQLLAPPQSTLPSS
jgi:AcrR family transcriptional regulator